MMALDRNKKGYAASGQTSRREQARYEAISAAEGLSSNNH
jgi:hypothetical protein